MFERLTGLFNHNEETFTSTQQLFLNHWQTVKEYLSSDAVRHVEDIYTTKAALHIADMIHMIENDVVPVDADYGPCVEYILQNDVLSSLQQYAKYDKPTGLMKIVLSFYSQLVQRLEISVIPHVNVHEPLQDMIAICGAGKYAIGEINFLTSVISKFHQNPSLVSLFMSETKLKNGSSNFELRLVDALISLSHSQEERVMMKSCEGLMLCCAVDSEYLIDSVLSYTILIQDLVSRLCQRYNSFQSDPDLILSTNVSWNNQIQDNLAAVSDRATTRLLLWVDFLSLLSTSSHPTFSNKLNRHIVKVFFNSHILHDVRSKQPNTVLKALNTCIKMLIICVSSELLLVEILKFLTDRSTLEVFCSLLNSQHQAVIERILLLFSDLIETHHSVVIETLVLQYTRVNGDIRTRLARDLRPEKSRDQIPTFKRSVSRDSGVDEEEEEDEVLTSDEETSFIHVNTSHPSYVFQQKSFCGGQDNSYCCEVQDDSSEEPAVSKIEEPAVSKIEEVDSPVIDPTVQLLQELEKGHAGTYADTTCSKRMITLEHTPTTSLSYYRTVIVPHDVIQARKHRTSTSTTFALENSVEAFLTLMRAYSQPGLVGYTEYLHDAHVKVRELQPEYSWMTVSSDSYTANSGESDKNEIGIFLEKILTMVTSIPYQSYTVNMMLMALISEIAYIPHPTVTTLLLDTTLPNNTLFLNLHDVADSFADIFEASPTLKAQLVAVKLESDEVADICKAAYLTNEFCKELAAISLVKATYIDKQVLELTSQKNVR